MARIVPPRRDRTVDARLQAVLHGICRKDATQANASSKAHMLERHCIGAVTKSKGYSSWKDTFQSSVRWKDQIATHDACRHRLTDGRDEGRDCANAGNNAALQAYMAVSLLVQTLQQAGVPAHLKGASKLGGDHVVRGGALAGKGQAILCISLGQLPSAPRLFGCCHRLRQTT